MAQRNLDQSKLNIVGRSRTSRLPWRGQFSPELIDYLMDTVCADARTFLDPFCGSGTVLFEAALKGYSAWGCEVNPAAWHLAAMAEVVTLDDAQKMRLRLALKEFAANISFGSNDLLDIGLHPEEIVRKLKAQSYSANMTRCVAAAILLGMGDRAQLTRADLSRGAVAVLGLLTEPLGGQAPALCYLADARELPMPSNVVEAVITSPPYINVFNYHQNYRPAAELLGWRPLEAAASEIGSNRKHRANRFLTVIQYALDMAEVLREMARVMAHGAPLVMVVGRTSNVLGASFKNGVIAQKLMCASRSFGPVQCEQRSFINRFGERIFEDILITHKNGEPHGFLEDARCIGMEALGRAQVEVPEKNRAALLAAIDGAKGVRLSPRLHISVPASFRRLLPVEAKIDEGYSRHPTRRQA